MMKYIRKSVPFLSMLLLCALVLSGCSEKAADSDTEPDTVTVNPSDDTVSDDTAPPAETDIGKEQIKDNLPDDLNFAGMDVSILYRGGVDEREIYVEELIGETVDDAVYNRNLDVSNRLNVKFSYIASGSGTAQEFPSEAKSAILANNNDYSIISWAQYSVLPLCMQNLIMDIGNAKYIDYEMPWWNEDYMKSIQIGTDKRFFLMGDINLNALKVTAATFFNQSLYTDAFGDVSGLYDMVLEGRWTVDALKQLSEGAYVDANGDGQKNSGDIFGMAATTVANTEMFAYGMGLNVIGRDSDGLPLLSVQTEHNINVLDKLSDLYWNNTGITTQYDDGQAFNGTAVSKMFAANELLFMPLWLKTCEDLRDMESDYGIIPYPKYSEAQENYISLVQDTSSIFCIPISCIEYEKVGAVIEAMCAENYRTVIPAYYDVALKSKYSRDEVSARMIDLIHETSATDFGYAYNYTLGNIGTVMRTVVGSQRDAASTIKSTEKMTKKQIKRLNDMYLGKEEG